MEQEPKKWGGKRQNSGRKPKINHKRIGFVASQDVAEILEKVPNTTAFIEEAVRELAKAKGLSV